MPEIAPIDWKLFEKFLLKAGCTFKRQKGSHRIYRRSDLNRPIIIVHGKDLPIGHIQSNLRSLKITRQEYLDILSDL